MWALRKIPRMPYTHHMTHVEVRANTGCHPLSHLVTDRRLRLFGHIASSSPQEDHHRAVAAVIRRLPPDRKQPLGLASCSRGRPWPTEHWPCICLEEGSYSTVLAVAIVLSKICHQAEVRKSSAHSQSKFFSLPGLRQC